MDGELPIHPSIVWPSSLVRSFAAAIDAVGCARSSRPADALSIHASSARLAVARRALGCRRSRLAVARRSISPAAFSEHFCSSGPTCLLIDRARAPMVFVGVTVPPVGVTNRSERRPIRTFFESIRLLGFAPAVGPCRRRR